MVLQEEESSQIFDLYISPQKNLLMSRSELEKWIHQSIERKITKKIVKRIKRKRRNRISFNNIEIDTTPIRKFCRKKSRKRKNMKKKNTIINNQKP